LGKEEKGPATGRKVEGKRLMYRPRLYVDHQRGQERNTAGLSEEGDPKQTKGGGRRKTANNQLGGGEIQKRIELQ